VWSSESSQGVGCCSRPEAIDAALRRPGRFDREVYFGLPSVEDREAILRVHTRRRGPAFCAQGPCSMHRVRRIKLCAADMLSVTER